MKYSNTETTQCYSQKDMSEDEINSHIHISAVSQTTPLQTAQAPVCKV